MMDGELASDEARFLFRRLQHDRELAGCWERWQVCSVLLRGQGTAVMLPADFSRRVAHAVALESSGRAFEGEQAVAATGTHPRRWAWWGGGAALAASLALLVVVPRQASDPASPTAGNARMATTAMPSQPAIAPAKAVSTDASHSPATPPAAVQLTTALAMAEAPRRIAARRSRAAAPKDTGRAPTAVPRAIASIDGAERVAAAEPPSLQLPVHANPFSPQEPEARPWPRAVLPGTANGAFTASYSTGATSAFYPFEPRSLPQPEPQAPAGVARP
jgi:negative regulator of sigma E activity